MAIGKRKHMGYNMSQVDAKFFVPVDKIPAMVEAIRNLYGGETIRDSSGRHFSWVSENFHTLTDAAQLLEAWRWDVEFDDDGNIDTVHFLGEKLGDDNILFDAIAPFVKAGSYVEMSGEDGDRWRWIFDGEAMLEKQAKVSWS